MIAIARYQVGGKTDSGVGRKKEVYGWTCSEKEPGGTDPLHHRAKKEIGREGMGVSRCNQRPGAIVKEPVHVAGELRGAGKVAQ